MTGLYFPQFANGIVAQYPIARTQCRPIYMNEVADGDNIRLLTEAPERFYWTLEYRALSDDEWDTIRTFFDSVRGRCNSFTFLDPTRNLLRWSEDFLQDAWLRDPLLQVTTGARDPNESTSAMQVTNTGQAIQSISQAIASPSWYQYCFSLHVRASTASALTFFASAGSDTVRESRAVNDGWQRQAYSIALNNRRDGIRFGFELEPGSSVVVYGAQVDAQAGPGSYKKTMSRSGIFSNSRFDQDTLTQITEAVNQHAVTLRIMAGT